MKHDLVANMIKDEDAYLHIGINYQKNRLSLVVAKKKLCMYLRSIHVSYASYRGVRFGFPFPGPRVRECKLVCGFQVPNFRNPGFGTSGVRNPSGFWVPRNPESITNFREKIIKVCVRVNFQSSQKHK